MHDEAVGKIVPRGTVEGGRKPLQKLRAGQRVDGQVRVVTESGLIVDIKAVQDAFLHMSELPEDLPLKSWKRQDCLTAHVLLVNATKQVLKLTLLKVSTLVLPAAAPPVPWR